MQLSLVTSSHSGTFFLWATVYFSSTQVMYSKSLYWGSHFFTFSLLQTLMLHSAQAIVLHLSSAASRQTSLFFSLAFSLSFHLTAVRRIFGFVFNDIPERNISAKVFDGGFVQRSKEHNKEKRENFEDTHDIDVLDLSITTK